MSPVEALQLALSRETEAHDLYLKLAQEHHNLKDLFEFLVIEEEKHKKLLEQKILEMTI
ncbi:MAG: hypothetical protein KJ915_06255 [Candidatus Omnitrophica bacterium]|nr:hypothetical protein [Candidatus Omnitrophota bacterium]